MLTRTRPIWIKSLAVALLMVIGGLVFVSFEAAASILLGAAIALGNFWLLERLVSGLLRQQQRHRWRLLAIFAVKMVVLFAAVGIAVLKVSIAIGPFLVGLSCIVVAIFLEGAQGLLGQGEDIS